MKRTHFPVIKTFPKFKESLEMAATERVKNGVEKKTPTSVEMTRMAMNTESWNRMIKELSIKPRKEDLE